MAHVEHLHEWTVAKELREEQREEERKESGQSPKGTGNRKAGGGDNVYDDNGVYDDDVFKNPTMNKAMIRNIMLITAAASTDESINSFSTLGAISGPAHMLWFKCLRHPCYRFWKRLKLDTFCKNIFCAKGVTNKDKKCYCFDKDCNNNWALLVVFLLYAVFIGLSFWPAFAGFIQSSLAIITVVLGYW